MSKGSDENELNEIIERIFQSNDFKELLEKLEPLVHKARLSQYSCSILKPCAHKLAIRGCSLQEKASIVNAVRKEAKKSQDTMLQALCYLGFFEVGIINLLDHIIMLLISNKIEFFMHYNHRRISAQTLEDLDNASLSEKLLFLNENGFSCVTKNVNRNLRNSIAHMDFECYNNGVIKIDNSDFDLQHHTVRVALFIIMVVTAFNKSGLLQYIGQLDNENKQNSSR